MQNIKSGSTLELVVNEQPMQNLSQVDLSATGTAEEARNRSRPSDNQQGINDGFSFDRIREWPSRFRENLTARLDAADAKSETRVEYGCKVAQAFSGLLAWLICFICTIILPVILLIIGLCNLDSCAERPSLPYLVFSIGFVMTASNLFNLALAIDLPILSNHKLLSSDVKNTIASILNVIFNCVAAFLYILSAYMVYSMSKKGQKHDIGDEGAPDCDGLLYDFTFWFITITLIMIVSLGMLATIFFAYNKYRLAIIRGSTPRPQV